MSHAQSEAPTSASPVPTSAGRYCFAQGLQGATLLALGFIVFFMTATGIFTNYLQPWYEVPLFASSAILWFFGLWTLIAAAEEIDLAGDSVTVHHPAPRIGALILVPVLLVSMAAPGPLGVDALERQPALTVPVAEDSGFPPLADGQANDMTLKQLLERYEWDDPEDLAGKQLRIVGFVGQESDGQRWSLNRFGIFCCAADARAYSAHISGAPRPERTFAWVEVVGVIDFDASGELPVLFVESVTEVPVPEEPYL